MLPTPHQPKEQALEMYYTAYELCLDMNKDAPEEINKTQAKRIVLYALKYITIVSTSQEIRTYWLEALDELNKI